ncbi:MAG: glycoside hydrolase family 15 protein [Elusimicrobia bacterium]|nr:glycoside hydrolase family 15 protein [Elusimicrobiota bacterium]
MHPQRRNGLFRLAVCRRGKVGVRVEVEPRFDYGASPARWTRRGGCWEAAAGESRAALRGAAGLAADGGRLEGAVELARGRCLPLAFVFGARAPRPLDEDEARESLRETAGFWRRWTSLARYDGPRRAEVLRSALALKALIYEPTGAMVAAPTTSLPESLGGARNWDYRFAWVRDTSMVLEVLDRLGYGRETAGFMAWLTRVIRRDRGALQIMYGLRGERDLAERELPGLSGYADSRPVRVGNGAYRQLQLDVFGEALDTAWVFEKSGGVLTGAEWEVLAHLADVACARWREKDAGIWEVRGGPRHFVYSKIMCWVAADRALKLARAQSRAEPEERLARWRAAAREIVESVTTDGWCEAKKSFAQSYGSDALDASVLMVGLTGMLPPDDPRVVSTLDAVLRELGDGPLVARYRSADGLAGAEGSFLLCGFWAVELLTRMGRLREARERFDALLALAGPLGLFSEEIEAKTRTALGNYPQALTHVGVIYAAWTLAKAERDARAARR